MMLRDAGIRREDVIESFVRSSGPGGQNVNKTATCVYLKHLPTGIEVKCGAERAQGRNRRRAWLILCAKVSGRRSQEASLRRQAVEKVRRRNRLKPLHLKKKILEAKRLHARKKRARSAMRREDSIFD